MDEQAKRLVCRMVAGLVASDEDFDDSERQFVDKVLVRFGIPETEWDAIFPLLEHDEAEAAMWRLDEAAQKETFELLLEAALADGTVVEAEREYLEIVGRAMGLSTEAVHARIAGGVGG
jgi:uncharacterized tellurite resistance protein B-like protein